MTATEPPYAVTLQSSACGALNPSWPAEPGRCTRPINHEGAHVHEGRTAALTWDGNSEGERHDD